MNRKQRRAVATTERRQGNDDLADKMEFYTNLPDHCLMCESPFDKTDREVVASWNVVVREAEKIVRLYCPSCWDAAQRVVEKYEEEKNNENNSKS